jgi:uncharacterized protein YgiM (DUF1202 family)
LLRLAAANLRQGPTTDFPVVGAAVEGQELTIVGQLADGSWYVLDNGAWILGSWSKMYRPMCRSWQHRQPPD